VVTVYEGRVRASLGEQALELSAGESARLHENSIQPLSEAEQSDTERELDEAAQPAEPVPTTPADVAADVDRLRKRLAGAEAQRARLETQLDTAERRLALAQGQPRERHEYDLSREDWAELAKTGTIKFSTPCLTADWKASAEQLDRAGLAPEDAPIVEAAHQHSYQRVWAVLRPLCSAALGGDEATDSVGANSCIHVIVNHAFKLDAAQAKDTMRQVGEIRAGLRAMPPGEEQNPLMKTFLALTAESALFERELAETFGPDDAKNIAFAKSLCMSSSAFGNPNPTQE
jgi:hypothetical protein